MAETVRVGILGAGGAGKGHATAFSRLPDVEVTALWSRTRARTEALAGQLDQPGIQVYDGWQELIERAEVDVISIATPETLCARPSPWPWSGDVTSWSRNRSASNWRTRKRSSAWPRTQTG